METWGVEHTFIISVVIRPETADDGPVVVVAEHIFRESTRHLLYTTLRTSFLGGHKEILVLIITVVRIAGTNRVFMMVIDNIGVKKDIDVVGELCGVVVFKPKIRIQFVVGQLLLDAEAGLRAIEDEACLGESLIAFGVDADAIITIHLAAVSGFLQGFDAQLAAEMACIGMVVTQEGAILGCHGIIEEAIAVAVHLHKVMADMAKQQQAITFTHVDASVEVQLCHSHRVDKSIDENFFRMIVLWFFEIDIDLSADGLIAVTDRRSAFGDRDAVHPGTRHITQAESRGETSEVRHVFCHHLGIETAKAK